jgi:hypothetical protein
METCPGMPVMLDTHAIRKWLILRHRSASRPLARDPTDSLPAPIGAGTRDVRYDDDEQCARQLTPAEKTQRPDL